MARQNFTGQHVRDNWSTPRRMLKKARLLTRPTLAATHPPTLSLPRQPLRPGTRLVPSGMLETREAYLVMRRSFPDSDVSRLTFHGSRERTENAAGGLFLSILLIPLR